MTNGIHAGVPSQDSAIDFVSCAGFDLLAKESVVQTFMGVIVSGRSGHSSAGVAGPKIAHK